MAALEDQTPFLFRDSTDKATFDDAVWGRVFNHQRDRSREPLAVCRARTVADVVAAVELGRERNCRVSVRSGGHAWAAWSVRHGAVLVDLANLVDADGSRVSYDEDTQVVSCSPSTTGETLNTFLSAVDGGKGRMFAGGHCPEVGLGGFLLQGGMGWNCKNWGWACESILAVDVVTADARPLRCSTAEHADLFWAARGAGPGFPAIVTRFHLATRPATQLYQSLYMFPIAEFKSALQWVVDLSPTADADTEIVVVTSYLSPSDETPTVLANLTTFKPSLAAAQAALQPIHDSLPSSLSPSATVFCQHTTLAAEYGKQRAANPEGHHYISDNAYVAADGTANIDIAELLAGPFTALPTRKACALWFSMAPTAQRALPDMALSLHSEHYVALYAVWEGGADLAAGSGPSADKDEDGERCAAWVANAMAGIERHSVGSYLGDADFQVRRTRFWSEGAGQRVRAVRRAWDPAGRICGFLDVGDASGVDGLRNEFEWL
ncbi:FAD binding domain protein [Lasiosphaeria miniovina]|uniref:FAD binding domain protein n=1 Tax=Lasiosphaeria miniovina TaxID=1954250 RepID=A0AA40BFE3_9PEZI|nr:FAD binding domain protein [Lasiosphaeria miniovina]KAK0733246.1 FAD binding domain protein [Lasiosphaeria miniovina]